MNCEKRFFKCFKMQMVINLAPVSLSNAKVNFYTCPRLTFLKKNATESAYKSISEPLDFKIFWGGMPPDSPKGSRLRRSKLASPCSEVSLRPWFPLGFGAKKDRGRGFSVLTEREMKREPLVPRAPKPHRNACHAGYH